MSSLNEHISSLSRVWQDWVYNNKIALDKTEDKKARYTASINCEKLISERYRLINNIDEYFENRFRKSD